jgi:two-component system sensor histidine kinase YesM
MKKVEAGDFNVHIAVKAHDEIGQLAEGLCEMAGKLEEYIRTSFVARIREKEAELSSLKAKIKPHFLYNSLEIIRMNAIAHDDESTAELALHLAEQMRASIEWTGETVPLSRELEMICGYSAFIDLRYDRRIAWDIHCDPSLRDAQVLSFMIQPIVENAVIHGVKPKGQGRIEINAEVQDRDLKITIWDDGIGMDEAAITKIRRRLEMDYQAPETSEDHDSTGLKNVHDRICYKYGASYGVSIESTPESGTSVSLLVPVLFSEAAHV